jgi:hypothetical protein
MVLVSRSATHAVRSIGFYYWLEVELVLRTDKINAGERSSGTRSL